jgi:hypothetical protein
MTQLKKLLAYLATRFEYYAKHVQTLDFDFDTWSLHHAGPHSVVNPTVLAVWAAMPELFPRCHAIWLNHHYVRLLYSPSGKAFFAAWMYQPHVDELWMKMDSSDVTAFERSDIQSAMTDKWAKLKTLRLDRKNRHGTRDQSWALPRIQSKWATLNSTLLAHAASLCDLRIMVPIGWVGVVVASTLPALTALDLSMVVELPHGECRLQAGAFPCLSFLCLEDPTHSQSVRPH